MTSPGSLSALFDEFGILDRQILIDRWLKPAKVEIRNGRLVYSGPWQIVTFRERVLFDFLELADRPEDDFAEAVKQYAQRWGVLELCKLHDWPSGHSIIYYDLEAPGTGRHCPPRLEQQSASPPGASSMTAEEFDQKVTEHLARLEKPMPQPLCWEPLSMWRFWSRQARSLLNVAGATHRGEPGNKADWFRLLPQLPKKAQQFQAQAEKVMSDPKAPGMDWLKLEARYKTITDEQFPWNGGDPWRIISINVNHWLELGRPRPICTIEKGKPTITLAPDPECGWLFAVLAAQILFAVTKAKRLLTCSSCGRLYIPEKLPRRGERTYCKKCGIRAAWRDAQARARKKS